MFLLFLENNQRFRRVGEVDAAVLDDVQHILDAHTELARQVDARLGGDDAARRKQGRAARGGRRRFVDLESDAVAEAARNITADDEPEGRSRKERRWFGKKKK